MYEPPSAYDLSKFGREDLAESLVFISTNPSGAEFPIRDTGGYPFVRNDQNTTDGLFL